jgi:hypothetical protein
VEELRRDLLPNPLPKGRGRKTLRGRGRKTRGRKRVLTREGGKGYNRDTRLQPLQPHGAFLFSVRLFIYIYFGCGYEPAHVKSPVELQSPRKRCMGGFVF